jgi:hypothetical protein
MLRINQLKKQLKLDLIKPIHFYISGCAQPAYLVKKEKKIIVLVTMKITNKVHCID